MQKRCYKFFFFFSFFLYGNNTFRFRDVLIFKSSGCIFCEIFLVILWNMLYLPISKSAWITLIWKFFCKKSDFLIWAFDFVRRKSLKYKTERGRAAKKVKNYEYFYPLYSSVWCSSSSHAMMNSMDLKMYNCCKLVKETWKMFSLLCRKSSSLPS